MSLKFLHQVIIFAAMSISLFFAAWCFISPDVAGAPRYLIAGVACIVIAIGLVFYEIHFLKRTRKLILH
jgi:hypothetical protein